MKILFAFVLGAMAALAQPLTFGLKAGVPLNDLVSTVQSPNYGFNSTTNRYILGPEVDLNLPLGLGVEFDALYRHYKFQSNQPPYSNTSTGAWEFPLLAKYRFPSPIVRPFVDAGVAWDRLQGLTQSASAVISSGLSISPAPSSTASAQVQHNTVHGYVVGGGLDVHLLFLHLSPEVRYTRWNAHHFFDPNGGFSNNENQAEFLLGIRF
jgi:opacity protein-like surface antigen